MRETYGMLKTLIISLALIPILSLALITLSATSVEDVVETFNRTVEVTYGGLVYITDEIEGVNRVSVGFSSTYSNLLIGYYSKDPSIKLSRVDKGGEDFLIKAEKEGKGNITVTYVFKGLVREESGFDFNVKFPYIPAVDSYIKKFNFRLFLPEGSQAKEWEPLKLRTVPRPEVFSELNNLTSPEFQESSVKFEDENYLLIKIINAEFRIEVESKSSVTATIKIKNEGLPKSSLTIKFPEGVSVTDVRDFFGRLESSFDKSSLTLNINLREELAKDEVASLTLSYIADKGVYVNMDGSKLTVKLPMLLNGTYMSYKLFLSIPSQIKIDVETVNPAPDFISKDWLGSVTLGFYNPMIAGINFSGEEFVPFPVAYIELPYEQVFTLAPAYPYIWGFVVVLGIASVLTYTKLGKHKPRISKEVVSKTTEILDGLESLLNLTSQAFLAFNPEGYSHERGKALVDRLLGESKKEIEKLRELKRVLERDVPRVNEVMAEVEPTWSEVSSLLSALIRTSDDFRLNRISRSVYRSIYRAYRKALASYMASLSDTLNDARTELLRAS